MIFNKKVISESEAYYSISNDEIIVSGGAQGSYNLEKNFFNYAIENNILIGSNIDYPRKKKDGVAYVVHEDYDFKLGLGVLWLIGEEYSNSKNKFIASINGTNNKPQLYNVVYKNMGPEYKWFVELYSKNISGNKLIFEIDEENKILTLDIGFDSFKQNDSASSKSFEAKKSQSNYNSKYSRNRIVFGAPGTGKSYSLNKEKDELLGDFKDNYERVTFHPDYSYAHFVGTYKPVPKKGDIDVISYEYVPGPFMRILVEALKPKNQNKPYLLIIEEINRANVAAVFGDIFQLLDRDDNGCSEYPIQASEDVKQYLSNELDGNPEDYKTIYIPSNLFIWATMNSADQGVYMMDTAFKRRWDFSYVDINESDDEISDKNVCLGKNNEVINWNSLRKAINTELLTYKINEDKLLGPFFIPLEYLPDVPEDNEKFINIFKNKVIMYLFEDVAKARRKSLFKNNGNKDYLLYSEICDDFDESGIEIFCDNIVKNLK